MHLDRDQSLVESFSSFIQQLDQSVLSCWQICLQSHMVS